MIIMNIEQEYMIYHFILIFDILFTHKNECHLLWLKFSSIASKHKIDEYRIICRGNINLIYLIYFENRIPMIMVCQENIESVFDVVYLVCFSLFCFA